MSTPQEDLILTLLKTLAEKTGQGGLEWRQTGREAFSLRREAGIVTIRSIDADGAAPFEFILTNEDGVAVERAVTSSGNQPLSYRLSNLFKMARRSAFHVPELVNSFVAQLDEPEPPAPEPATPNVASEDADDIPF